VLFTISPFSVYEMTQKNLVTILGVGNILFADEGFGVHFVRWFSGRYLLPGQVRAIDGGTLGYALLDIICSCEHLIVIDVIRLNDAPGSMYRFTRDEIESCLPPPTSAHEVKFLDVLCKAELLDDLPQVVFLCIVPGHYGNMDLEMTDVMKNKFGDMEKQLLKELAIHNVVPEKI
jgi:hydrogenase maturation protease